MCSGQPLGFDALRSMHYLHAALTESMRLYPPASMDSQSCVARSWTTRCLMARASEWAGPSLTAAPTPWAVSRPYGATTAPSSGWNGGSGAFRTESPFRYTMTMFHAGPRMCLAKEMAYVEMKSIVASVLEEFVVDVRKEVGGGDVPEHVLSVTLRMKGGLPVQVRWLDVLNDSPEHGQQCI